MLCPLRSVNGSRFLPSEHPFRIESRAAKQWGMRFTEEVIAVNDDRGGMIARQDGDEMNGSAISPFVGRENELAIVRRQLGHLVGGPAGS